MSFLPEGLTVTLDRLGLIELVKTSGDAIHMLEGLRVLRGAGAIEARPSVSLGVLP